MCEYYILVRSVTYAQKAAYVLGSRGIRNRVIRRPHGISVGGCGYAVRVAAGAGVDPIGLSSLLINSGAPDFRIFGTRDGVNFIELHNGY